MSSVPKIESIRASFSETLVDLASDNQNIYVVSADLKSSVALDKFANKFRSRFIECGVAEANAAGVAAGLAKSGKTVFLVTYACFSPGINWSVIKQSICYNRQNVKIVGSHGGLMTGDLGATHQMLEDVALMRTMPNMEVFAPIDAIETQKIIKAVSRSQKPSYIRLVRPSTPVVFPGKLSFSIGTSHVLKSGTDVTILGYGPVLTQAFGIDKFSLEIINVSSIKPLDELTILQSVKKTGRVIVIEDHQKNGGLGDAIANLILTNNLHPKFIHLGINNQFGQSAKDYQTLYDHYGISQKDIINSIKKIL